MTLHEIALRLSRLACDVSLRNNLGESIEDIDFDKRLDIRRELENIRDAFSPYEVKNDE